MRVAIRIALGLAVLFFLVETRADTIYRCELDGAITFADRPCGVDAKKYEPDTTRVSEFKSVPVSHESSVHIQSRPPHSRVSPSIAESQTAHAEECRRIHDSLSAVRSKMRAGYTAKEGERLKEREQKLNASRRAKRC
jgi:hypothetical protein